VVDSALLGGAAVDEASFQEPIDGAALGSNVTRPALR
jgi:hypothetical protein